MSISLEIASSVFTLAVVLYHFIQDHRTKTITNPITILARAAGFAILPQAGVLIFATFDPGLLCTVQGLRPFFMLSGLAIIYVCMKSVTS